MTPIKLAIIGGSTVSELAQAEVKEEFLLDTPFGQLSHPVKKYKLHDTEFYFLHRHGEGHVIPPSDINYRANIFTLKQLGVTHVLSVSAVGSLQEDMRPGDIVLPNQYIDWTKGLRQRSFFGKNSVGHVSAADVACKELSQNIHNICEDLKIRHHVDGTYICIEGPQFSSRAESHLFRSFGASIIGMTNLPEAYLAAEAGLKYLSMCMVTDYDAWKEEACDTQSIYQVLLANKQTFLRILDALLTKLPSLDLKRAPSQKGAFFTDKKKVPKETLDMLEILFS